MIHYGEETRKALAILGKDQTPREMIRAYGEVKLAALRGQQESSALYPEDYYPLLEQAALEVIEGEHDEQFPLPLRQGGAGTSLHMNICEVLSSLANGRYTGSFRAHPLDHLAKFQSTNDTFPTAVIIMTCRFLGDIESRVVGLQEGLVRRETVYQEWLMCGRTEMQDALPMTLGQLFSAWAGPVERDRWRLNKLSERLRQVPLGGTALGTGFSAPRRYLFAAERALRSITGLPVCRSQNLCDQVAHTDALAEAAHGLGLVADNLVKWAADLLLYSSSFLKEIPQEEQQYGSTMMPDKANPVLIELIRGLGLEASSRAGLVARYCSEGQLQLNAYQPFIACQMIDLYRSLSRALETAADKLLPALQPDRERLEANLMGSPAMLNVLREPLGYQGVKDLLPRLREAGLKNRRELIDWLADNSVLGREDLENRFQLNNLTGGGTV